MRAEDDGNDPVFTVVCPTYNRSRAILPTLKSVQGQDQASWEALVVSDGSTDDTDDVVRHAAADDDRIRLVRIEHCGHPSGPRNEALRRARGRYIAYIDHDDGWEPGHLRELQGLLDAGADWAVTGARRVTPDGILVGTTGVLEQLWHPELQVQGPRFEPTRVGHRAGIGPGEPLWDEHEQGAEDWDLWLRLTDQGYRPSISARRTARITLDPNSRRFAPRAQYAHIVRRFPSVEAAREAVDRLADPEHAPRIRQAVLADLKAWYREMLDSGELRWPAGVPRPDVDRLIDEHADELASWRPFPVAPDTDGAAVVQPVPCLNRAHAERGIALIERTQARQLALAAEILGGEPPDA